MRVPLEIGETDPPLTAQAGRRQLPSPPLAPAWEREEHPPIGRALAERRKKNPSHRCYQGLTDLKLKVREGVGLLLQLGRSHKCVYDRGWCLALSMNHVYVWTGTRCGMTCADSPD
ncbi:hypothetical protein V3C99_005248 [Haemonchus contortus]